MKVNDIIKKTSAMTAKEVIKQLNNQQHNCGRKYNSFTRTEAMLRLYECLPDDHPEKQKIEKALDKVKQDEHYDVIEMYYFENKTFEQIAATHNCKYTTVSRWRNKLVNILAKELFLDEVIKEIRNS